MRNQLIAYFLWCFANLTNVDSGRYYSFYAVVIITGKYMLG